MPAGLAAARGRGGGDRAAAARAARRPRRPDRAACATREQRRADLRAQLAANETGCARLLELARRRFGRQRRSPGWPRSSTTPSGGPARGWPSCLTGAGARRTCSRAGPRAPMTSTLGGPRHDRRRRAGARLLRERRAGRGQPELPAAGHPLGGAVRGAGPARSRRAGVRGRAPAGAGDRSRGLDPERARARCRRGGQRRDVEPGRRPRARRARARRPAGPPRARGR